MRSASRGRVLLARRPFGDVRLSMWRMARSAGSATAGGARRGHLVPSPQAGTALDGRMGAWTSDELRAVRRPSMWATPPPRPAEGPLTAEAAVVAGVTALHVVDHAVVPAAVQPGLHLAVAAGAVGAALGAGATLDELGLAPDRVGAGLRHGAVVGAVIAGAVTGAATVPATRPLFNDVRLATATNATVASTALLRIPFGTALYEEVVFRGVLMGLALRRTSPLVALGVTSAAFGLWHVLPTLADHAHHPLTKDRARLTSVAGAVANTTVAGVGFGSARLRSGSVVAPIIAHTASNVAAYLAAAVVTRRRYASLQRRGDGPAAQSDVSRSPRAGAVAGDPP